MFLARVPSILRSSAFPSSLRAAGSDAPRPERSAVPHWIPCAFCLRPAHFPHSLEHVTDLLLSRVNHFLEPSRCSRSVDTASFHSLTFVILLKHLARILFLTRFGDPSGDDDPLTWIRGCSLVSILRHAPKGRFEFQGALETHLVEQKHNLS